MSSLRSFAENVYSQNGEDGILREIIQRISLRVDVPRSFLEIGAHDGETYSNCRSLALDGWGGLCIEANRGRYAKLEALYRNNPKVDTLNSIVTPSNVDQLIKVFKTLPKHFGVLSLDIDSNDWDVWAQLSEFRPMIAVLEINSHIRPGVLAYEGYCAGDGCSWEVMKSVCGAKGYDIVCHVGNVIAVESSFVQYLELPEEELGSPDLLFNYRWIKVLEKRDR